MTPRFPIYIVSKGRADSRLTIKALRAMEVSFHVIVERQEFDDYAKHVSANELLILDTEYQRKYDTFDLLGDAKSKGPGPARNFAWDHSIANGHKWHWVMDDNISNFMRLQNNKKIKVMDGSFFSLMEGFCLRYTNVAMAGPNYKFFIDQRKDVPPFVTNTRIYSCNLIRNDTPFRWRGRYNEDTDLSLRMLKSNWCTIQFNAFLQNKMVTQALKGGNTAEFYAKEGTRAKSEMQVAMHPDVSKIVQRFGRVHHYVDYRRFKTNKLIRNDSPIEKLDLKFKLVKLKE